MPYWTEIGQSGTSGFNGFSLKKTTTQVSLKKN